MSKQLQAQNSDGEDHNSVQEKLSKPPNLTYKSADLLIAKEEYIIHQCNCVTTRAVGLAQDIATKYPYASPYAFRRHNRNQPSRCIPEDISKPGTFQVWRDPKGNGPQFIGFYSQYNPGKPHGKEDSYEVREEWFRQCLDAIKEIEGLRSVAFPWKIGCGLAGGKWEVYERMITEWAEKNPEISVVIYCKV